MATQMDAVEHGMMVFIAKREFLDPDEDIIDRFVSSFCYEYLKIYESLAKSVTSCHENGQLIPDHLQQYLIFAESKYLEMKIPLQKINFSRYKIKHAVKECGVPDGFDDAAKLAKSLAELGGISQVFICNSDAEPDWILKNPYKSLKDSIAGGLIATAFQYYIDRKQIIDNQRLLILNHFLFDNIKTNSKLTKEFCEAMKNLEWLIKEDPNDEILVKGIKQNDTFEIIEKAFYKSTDETTSEFLKQVLDLLDNLKI